MNKFKNRTILFSIESHQVKNSDGFFFIYNFQRNLFSIYFIFVTSEAY